jgi:hypothetical protein
LGFPHLFQTTACIEFELQFQTDISAVEQRILDVLRKQHLNDSEFHQRDELEFIFSMDHPEQAELAESERHRGLSHALHSDYEHLLRCKLLLLENREKFFSDNHYRSVGLDGDFSSEFESVASASPRLLSGNLRYDVSPEERIGLAVQSPPLLTLISHPVVDSSIQCDIAQSFSLNSEAVNSDHDRLSIVPYESQRSSHLGSSVWQFIITLIVLMLSAVVLTCNAMLNEPRFPPCS